MLTHDQLVALKNDIRSRPEFWNQATQTQLQDDTIIAAFYNSVATPDFVLWNSKTPVSDIFDKIQWSKLTPAASTLDTTLVYSNRAILCQGKQFNIQTMLSGRETIDATRSNVRSGLQDALTNVPSAADGSNQSAGWANVQTAMQKLATNLQKLFSTGTGTTASPAVTSYEEPLQPAEVTAAQQA